MKFLLPVELQNEPLVNILNLDDDETVTQILPVEDFAEDKYVFMATRNGTVKKTSLKFCKKI